MYFPGLRESGESARPRVEVVTNQEMSRVLIHKVNPPPTTHVCITQGHWTIGHAIHSHVIFAAHPSALAGEYVPMAHVIARMVILGSIARLTDRVILVLWIAYWNAALLASLALWENVAPLALPLILQDLVALARLMHVVFVVERITSLTFKENVVRS